ncbi:MAG: uncharacterized protein PWQ12_1165 [Clostridiales bacterium]|jgi:hypothetical protein|nr:uncharacterized protein [Clostridiales bacterium]
MFYTGKVQKLYVNRISDYGAYLSDQHNGEDEILLPEKEMPKDLAIDQEVEGFVYRNADKNQVVSLKRPTIVVGEIAELVILKKSKNGYFLDFGLEKDLFLPYNEAKGQFEEGDKVRVMLCLDPKDQLYASMKLYNHLETAGDAFKVNMHVKGLVYEIKPEMGAFVAVDGRYHGFIPKHELYKEIKPGAQIEARVTKIREDGRLNLSIREKAALQIHSDVDVIVEALKKEGGELFLNDESEPELIKRKLNLSKRAFKRGVGRLLKEGRIEMLESGIRLIR